MYTLYHGSEKIIREPKYGIGNIKNDYGQAFYCTQIKELACEWAVTESRNGYCNIYDFQNEGLNGLNLMDDNYQILNWLAILLDNRTFKLNSTIATSAKKYIIENFLPDYRKYDYIRGYRADDSYFSFANVFLNNGLSLEKLSEAMRLGDLGEQIAICTPKAFDKIKYVDSMEVSRIDFYPLKKSRDDMARLKYQEMKDDITEGTYILDIIRQKWRNRDVRI